MRVFLQICCVFLFLLFGDVQAQQYVPMNQPAQGNLQDVQAPQQPDIHKQPVNIQSNHQQNNAPPQQPLSPNVQHQQGQLPSQQRSNELPQKIQQQPGAVPVQQFSAVPPQWQQSNVAPPQQFNAPSGQQMSGQPNAVPMHQFNVPAQQMAQQQPGVVPQQPGAIPQQPGAVPQQPGAVPQHPGATPQQPGAVPQQSAAIPQQSAAIPQQPGAVPQQPGAILQQPGVVPQPPGVIPQQPAAVPQQPGAVPQQQQHINVRPAQPVVDPKQPDVPLQQPNIQQMPQQVPVVKQQQQEPARSPPVANHQVPPVQSSQAPPHVHNEPPIRSYERHSHESLPPKPRQMKFDPPTFLHQDPELDFYSRLPSPQKSDADVSKNVDAPRPFIPLTVNVTPAVKDCYFYEAVTGFDVDVQVLGGDGMDIGLAVFDPSGTPVVLRDPAGEASVSIAVPPHYQGRAYAICLDNRKASYGRKKVYLGIDLRINWDNPSPAEQEIINQMKRNLRIDDNSVEIRRVFENFDSLTAKPPLLKDSLDRISGLLHRTQRLNQRSRNNAAMDRAMMEANKDRVTSWSTFQAVLLILVGIIQTRLIRSLFDEQSSLYRLWVHNGGSRGGGGAKFTAHVSGLRC
ncbi:putative surface protein bspA-like [Taenia solium]|eukprot:TsM_000118200 transcript=TsM_000118200 gene=TsM_000118200